MRILFFDPRTDFFHFLGEKLGPDFQLEALADLEHDSILSADVIVLGFPLETEERAVQVARLQRLVRTPGMAPVIVFFSAPDRQAMRHAFAHGAYDVFVETGSMEELRIVFARAARYHELNREVSRLRQARVSATGFDSVIGSDAKMQTVLTFAAKVAPTDANLLITGDTGTGKELLAHAIHRASPRAAHPFVAVACSSLPETLIEAELFGHEKGAFTGAATQRRGRFEAAERGTIFLDEIGELSPALQVKLLRVLQERTFERLGSNQTRRMEARVICATHRNLWELVKSGAFRADLYYRLNTVEIQLPPLRERRDDIIPLALSFLRFYATKHSRPARRLAPLTMSILQEYDWPGNVRELQNVIERAVVVSDDAEVRYEHLPVQFSVSVEDEADTAASFDGEVRNFKRRLIQRTLIENGNNKLQTARSLKIARSSLHRLIDELDVNLPNEFLN